MEINKICESQRGKERESKKEKSYIKKIRKEKESKRVVKASDVGTREIGRKRD